MNPASLVNDQLHYLQHILDTVPFAPGTKTSGFFLDVYKLTYPDIKSLKVTEKSWDSYNQVSANKLLKLSISFGNLIKTFHLEKAHYESKYAAKNSHQNQPNSRKPSRQSVDPFQDSFTQEKSFCVAPYYVSFTKNFFLILKNFDIGSAAGSTGHSNGLSSGTPYSRVSQISRTSLGESEVISVNGSQTSAPHVSSPIKLNSRQLLIEKLEININLDALFTFKINLKLLHRLFLILKQSLGTYLPSEENMEDPLVKTHSENSSIFSSLSGTSTGIDSIASMDEYAGLISEIARRVSTGIVDPFADLLRETIVKPHVFGGFQDLVNTI